MKREGRMPFIQAERKPYIPNCCTVEIPQAPDRANNSPMLTARVGRVSLGTKKMFFQKLQDILNMNPGKRSRPWALYSVRTGLPKLR